MSIEIIGLSVGECLFGMIIWAEYFLLLRCDFLKKKIGKDVMMEVVVDVGINHQYCPFLGVFCFFAVFPKPSSSKRTIKYYEILTVLKHYISEYIISCTCYLFIYLNVT